MATTPLAEVADVLRVLRSTSLQDAERVAPLLEAVIEFVQVTFKGGWGQDPNVPAVYTEYNVMPDAFIKIPDPKPTITDVKVFPTQSLDVNNIFILNDGLYQLMDDGVVQLQISNLVAVPGVEMVSMRVVRRLLTKVEVHYMPSGIVPTMVREAVALICAATYAQQNHDLSGVTMERIGSYEYMYGSRGGAQQDVYVIPTRARQWLRLRSRRLAARIV